MTTNKQKSGVYRIKNLETGAMYIGQTAESFARRWGKHRWELKAGRHANIHLQNSYNKHGKDAFEFKVLEVIPQCDMTDREFDDYINEREIILIAEHDTFENGYNKTEGGGGNRGRTFGEDARANMSAAHMGKKLGPHSEETKAKISAAHKGKKQGPHSEEHKAKIAAGLRADWARNPRKHSEATKAKLSDANKGKKNGPPSAETRAKISATKRGKGKPWSALRRARYEARK